MCEVVFVYFKTPTAFTMEGFVLFFVREGPPGSWFCQLLTYLFNNCSFFPSSVLLRSYSFKNCILQEADCFLKLAIKFFLEEKQNPNSLPERML